jgi:hypothetical protein
MFSACYQVLTAHCTPLGSNPSKTTIQQPIRTLYHLLVDTVASQTSDVGKTLTTLLIKSDEQRPDSRLASQETPSLLWKSNVYYRYSERPKIAIRGRIIPTHILTPHFLNIHFNIIL